MIAARDAHKGIAAPDAHKGIAAPDAHKGIAAPDAHKGIDKRGTCKADAVTVGEDVHMVAAGLLKRGGRGLLLHRAPARRWYPDCWDLPGGHVEDGETPDAALRRELREELGVTAVITGTPFAQVLGADFRMDVWVVESWDGEPANLDPTEHDALAWLHHREMMALKLADARLPALFEAALR